MQSERVLLELCRDVMYKRVYSSQLLLSYLVGGDVIKSTMLLDV